MGNSTSDPKSFPARDGEAAITYGPVPDAWLQRPLTPDPEIAWPVERVEVRDSHRGPLAWGGYLALRFAQATLGRLPAGARRALGAGLARIVAPLDRRHTLAALDFVQSALPNASLAEQKRLVRASWVHLLELSLRAPYASKQILHQPLGSCFQVFATEPARALAEARTPVIFVTAHVGHWELAGIALATLGFAPMYAVGKAPRNDPLSRFMQRSREQQGGRMLPRKDAMKSVPSVLRGGGSVLFLLDHRARSKPVYAPFFRRPAACERSASVLLRRLGVPLVFCACYQGPTEGTYSLYLGPVFEPKDLLGLDPARMAELLNGQFETMILRHPEQYFWLHDRFRSTPRRFEDLGEEAGPFADGGPV